MQSLVLNLVLLSSKPILTKLWFHTSEMSFHDCFLYMFLWFLMYLEITITFTQQSSHTATHGDHNQHTLQPTIQFTISTPYVHNQLALWTCNQVVSKTYIQVTLSPTISSLLDSQPAHLGSPLGHFQVYNQLTIRLVFSTHTHFLLSVLLLSCNFI